MAPSPRMRQLGRLVQTCALPMVGAFFVITSLIGAIRAYSPVPYADLWDGYIQFFMALKRGDWEQWYSLAGQHRIVFSRIFFWLDMRYFGGLSVLLLTVNWILMAVLWAELCYSASILLRPRTSLLLVTSSLLLIPTFSWLQAWNITWGNQTQFFAAYAFPLAAFQSLALSLRPGRTRAWFCLALIFGSISAVTMGNGTLALPLLIVMVLMTGHRVGSRLIALVPLTAASLYFYFQDAVTSVETVATWRASLKFMLEFLGAPAGRMFNSPELAVIGGIALFAGGLYSLAAWFRRAEREPMFLALLVFLAYVGASSVGAALCRAASTMSDPMSGRYSTASLLGWSALAIMLIARFRGTPELCGAMLVISVVIPLAFLPSQLEAFGNYFPTMNRERLRAALALDLGIRDSAIIANVYPDDDYFEGIAVEARRQNLSIFGVPEMVLARRSLGLPAADLGYVACEGKVEGIIPIPGVPDARRVRGWAYDTRHRKAPALVFLADENGVLIGAAFCGKPRPDLGGGPDDRARFAGFDGFVRRCPEGEMKLYCAD